MMSTLVIHGVPIECINQAAITYFVPAKVILSILLTEAGKVGKVNSNKNGTYDIGPMQINSTWLPILSKYGLTADQVQYNPCINVMVGTWILSEKIANLAMSASNYWQGVANYHSLTPALNQNYQNQIRSNFTLINAALNSNG